MRIFPPVNGDEVSNTVYGSNFLHGHGLRTHLMDDVFEPTLRHISDAGFELTRVLYNPIVGVWTCLIGTDYAQVRLLSSVMGALTLFLFYLIGSRIANPGVGLMCVGVAAIHPFFFTIGLLIRPESMLLLTATFILWLELKVDALWPWKPFLLGVLTGLGVGIHQNITVFFAGLLLFHVLHQQEQRKAKHIGLLLGGFFVGGLVIILFIDLKKLLLTPLAFHLQFYRAPLLTFPWKPLEWLTSSIASVLHGQTYYFNTTVSSLWKRANDMALFGVMGALFGLLIQRQKKMSDFPFDARPWAVALGGCFLALSVLVKRREVLYLTVLFPFLIPLVACGLWRWQKKTVVAGGIFLLVFLGAFGMTQAFYRALAARSMPQKDIVLRLESLIGNKNAKVMGPATLWFGWPSPNFRDTGAIYFSYLFTGQISLPRWLGQWKPDILIADESWSRAILRERPNSDQLSNLMGVPVELIGTVDTRLSMGLLDVYRVHWE